MAQEQQKNVNYFVDEAGDLTLFNRKGRLVINHPGVSSVFMVGVAYLPKPELAREYLESLRQGLLADPYFKGVPSMQPGAKKTDLCFHACKDVPEVRHAVFTLLPRLGAQVQVAIRRKPEIAADARLAHRLGRKLDADVVYDDLVKRLFKNILHKAAENRIIFARRGKSDRYEALFQAISRAKENFERTHGIPSDKPTAIRSASPHEYVGLQVIDYYLWALQRLYERGEDRFFNLLAPAYRVIMDLDDKRNREYGEWYSDNNPLTLARIKPVAS